jgi:hypothetical protein
MSVRAEIIDTGVEYLYKAKLVINKPAKELFDFVSQPSNHSRIDGSGMVKRKLIGPEKLFLGAKFGMKMKQGIPYYIKNQVIDFQDGKTIAWQHILHNVWRYEFNAVDKNTTEVTETWDARGARAMWWIRRHEPSSWVPIAMAKSLVNLKNLAEND